MEVHPKELTCVIVKYKTSELCEKLVSGLCSNDINVIVSDNFAEDTPQTLTENKNGYIYIDNGANLGFGKAANKAAFLANSDWLLILNSDLDMNSQDANMLVKRSMEAELDASCPSTQDPRYNEPLPSFWWFLARFTPLKRFSYFSILASKKPLTLWGGCLLIKKSVFEKLGGFDERFFLWFEDSDLTKRLIDGGYKVGRVDMPEIGHIGGVSFEAMSEKEKRKVFFTSALTYVRIHGKLHDKLLVQMLKLRYS